MMKEKLLKYEKMCFIDVEDEERGRTFVIQLLRKLLEEASEETRDLWRSAGGDAVIERKKKYLVSYVCIYLHCSASTAARKL